MASGEGMETIETLSLLLGTAWASGINLYATIFVLGYLGATGSVALPPSLEILSDPLVLTAAGVMYCIEFLADKTPGVDSIWDMLHTFVRIPAGALMAAALAQGIDVGPAAELAALLAGGGLAASSHFTKAGARVMINTSPEPFSNWGASISEDIAVFAGLWAALNHPLVFLTLLGLFLLLSIWLLPKLWRGLKRLLASLGKLLGLSATTPQPARDETMSQPDPPQQLYNGTDTNGR
jgi:hypothetical protein